MSNNTPTRLKEWNALTQHQKALSGVSLPDLFTAQPERASRYVLEHDGLALDYSRNRLNDETLELLCNLAQGQDLSGRINALFDGEHLNTSENRPALHMALRGSCDNGLNVDGQDITANVERTLTQIEDFTARFHADGQYTDIVHIGIGGSDIGPHLVCQSLSHLAHKHIRLHFLSNIDPDSLAEILDVIPAETTLFIVASKSFSTQEPISNAYSVKNWLAERLPKGRDPLAQFCAVTGNHDAAKAFGIAPDKIFDLPDWVGGRFSLWSAVGLPIALYLGFDHFKSLLDGAKSADIHFKTQPFAKNIPVLMALIGIWYRNFWNYNATCILPYATKLSLFPNFIQQLDMESNGKSVDLNGHPLAYATAPVVFGGTGSIAQHTFFQFLHQGHDIVPCDFIACKKPVYNYGEHHAKLISNVIGQTKALMEGRKNDAEPHRNFEGNRPSNIIWLDSLTPYTMGLLIAFFEHKIFVQGALWNINSFDQFGVELGKELAKNALQVMRHGE